MGHWLRHVLGLDNGSGGWYLWWSGFGSDLAEFAIIGAVLGAYHRHNCHQPRCFRISRHTITDPNGVTHNACRKHRPHVVAATR